MIDIIRKEDCVGCNACAQRCPKTCISMESDEQGFLYPKVDLDRCIDCHMCERVCPVINQSEPRKPLETYAAKNKDTEIQRQSSSGGVFFALAEKTIEDGGVVFGARFDENWEVIHDFAESLEQVKAFQGSKYVQSRIDDNFKRAEMFLKTGRRVLFSGTPCQIAGLKLFLRKDWGEQLLCVDLVCHGVPSPIIWRDYVKEITRPKGASAGKNTDFQSTLNVKTPVVTGISFRDKRISWEKFGFSVHAVARKGDKNSDFQSTICQYEEQELLFETLDCNLYMQGFLRDLYLRPSCYACPTKCGKSHSDITLADFWGIDRSDPDLYKKGFYSLVLANSENGYENLVSASIYREVKKYSDALVYNPALERSSIKPRLYNQFWTKYEKDGLKAISATIKKMRPTMIRRIANRVKRAIHAIFKQIAGIK